MSFSADPGQAGNADLASAARLAALRQAVHLWKAGERTDCSLEIVDASGQRCGELHPVDRHRAVDPAVIEAITRWRLQFRDFFFSQFTPTADRTAHWLQTYLQDDSRLLFLISDLAGRWLGHVGFCRLECESAELDNVMRAEPHAQPGIGQFATLRLLTCLFASARVDRVSLRVFADNSRAIAMYETLGFRRHSSVPLIAETVADEIHFRPAAAEAASLSARHLLEMELARNEWQARQAPFRPASQSTPLFAIYPAEQNAAGPILRSPALYVNTQPRN